ncbi:hypothetical protein [Caballeronia sordidicola]|uniref:hypothetical protein n=1 Tax=Caballeronia sordidicola TaxID=196367 RepID=UPI000AEAD893|nr:hypothetical protein [Caballeronia sordidicola]
MKDDIRFDKLIERVVSFRQQGIHYFRTCEDAIANGGPPPPLPIVSKSHIDAVDTRTISVEPDAIELRMLRTLHDCYGRQLFDDDGLKSMIRTFSIQGGRNVLHRIFISDRHGDYRLRFILDEAIVPLKALFDKNPDYFLPDALEVLSRLGKR